MQRMSLSDGTRVVIRPIRPDDKPLLAAGHARLSLETVYRRYLGPKPRLSSSDLAYLTEVDGRDHVALVALLADGPPAIIAVGRFVREREDPERAEFAIVVGDDYQRRGLGTELAVMLTGIARSRGVKRMHAFTLADNVAAQRLI